MRAEMRKVICPECGCVFVPTPENFLRDQEGNRLLIFPCGHKLTFAGIHRRYRKKPVVIEAFQLGVDPIPEWFLDASMSGKVILQDYPNTEASIETLEGWHHANYGDFVIRGVKGEIYPCKPDIFHLTYEEVSQ